MTYIVLFLLVFAAFLIREIVRGWDDAVPNDMDKYCGICGQAIDWEEN